MTLEPDVQALVTRTMRERGLTFKQAVNDAIRRGMSGDGGGRTAPVVEIHDLGQPLVDVTKALRLAGELEDQELARKLAQGK